jgi:hypothetical protein
MRSYAERVRAVHEPVAADRQPGDVDGLALEVRGVIVGVAHRDPLDHPPKPRARQPAVRPPGRPAYRQRYLQYASEIASSMAGRPTG